MKLNAKTVLAIICLALLGALLMAGVRTANGHESTWNYQQGEVALNTQWCTWLTGSKFNAEYRLPNRQRVDCVDKEHNIAWEADWPGKWPECLTQALNYGMLLGMEAGCVLMIRLRAECYHYWRAVTLIRHQKLPVTMAMYPLNCLAPENYY